MNSDRVRVDGLTMERFSVESCVRGYHVYKDIWIACVGEELPCQRENGNPTDPFAVAVVKSGLTVGHILRKISSVCSLFLRRNGVMTVCTTERRRFSADLPQGGLEIPCLITFEGAGKDIQKVRKLVTAAMLPTDDIQQTKLVLGAVRIQGSGCSVVGSSLRTRTSKFFSLDKS